MVDSPWPGHKSPLSSKFQDGGAVRQGSLYIERRADRELFDSLHRGEFCYVLAPRQIGKSSLRIRTQMRLREHGIRCASIDLTRIGTAGVTAEEWYFSLIDELAAPLMLARDPAEFWKRRSDLSPVHRFTRFLEKEVLETVDEPVVINVDEIEMVLSLPFPRDDFFAAIRAIYNARAEDSRYGRLNFCLFGLATPGELMDDPIHTPFNIGRGIKIEDFTVEEAQGFLPGLEQEGEAAQALLDAVLEWTNGHPYMTQRVCSQLVLQSPTARRGLRVDQRVEHIVREHFLERGRTEDMSLVDPERRLQKLSPGTTRTEAFRIYRRLLHGARVPFQGDNPAQKALWLAGVARECSGSRGKNIEIRNRIIATVFDLDWVNENTAANPLSEAVTQWLHFQKMGDFLLQGVALEVARDWAQGRTDLSPEEREFIDRCIAAEDARQMAERSVRDQKNRRILSTALIILLALVGLAFWRERDATERLAVATEKIVAIQSSAEKSEREALAHKNMFQNTADELDRMAKNFDRSRSDSTSAIKHLEERAKMARTRAAEEQKAAVEARNIANDAATALQSSKAELQTAKQALAAEQAARKLAEEQLRLAEKQIQELREDRQRLVEELARIDGRHGIWQEDSPDAGVIVPPWPLPGNQITHEGSPDAGVPIPGWSRPDVH